MSRRGGEPLLTRAFLLVSAAHFLHGLGVHAYLHFPGFLDRLGADELEIGTVVALMSVTAIACRLVSGRIMDRFGRRPVVLLGGAISLGTALLYLSVSAIGPWLGVVRIVHGIGHALVFASLFTCAVDIMPASRRAEGIALFGISGMIPLSLGGLFGDLVLARADYDALFVGVAVCALAGLVFSVPLPESRPPDGASDPGGHLAGMVDAPLRPVWFMTIGAGIGMSSCFVFIKTFVLDHGIGSVGGFFSVYAWTAIVLRISFGHLPERVGLRRTLMPASMALAVGLALLGWPGGEPAFYAAAVLCGAGHGYIFPILSALALERARPGLRSTAVSIYTAFFDLALLVGGPSLGAVARGYGHGAMFGVTSALVMLSMLIFWTWDRRFVSMTDARALPSLPARG